MNLTRLRNAVLTCTATVGALCLVAAAVCAVFGLRPLVFQSGSMGPTIPTGSVALASTVPAAQLEKGDVVSVFAANGVRVTHRIIELNRAGQQAQLTLQGDANSTPDREVYTVTEADRVLVHVPWVGYAVDAMRTGPGLFVLGALALLMVLFVVRPARGAVVVAVAVLGGSALALGGGRPAPTMAWFTDAGSVTTASLATHTVVAPASASCSSAALAATVQWPVDSRYDYEVVLRRISNGTVVSTTQVTGSSSSITYSGLASFGLVVGAGTVDFQVEIRSYLANTPAWKSSGTRTYQSLRVLAILVGATVSCTT